MSAKTHNPNFSVLSTPECASDLMDNVHIDAQQVDHLLIIKAFADDLNLVETINGLVSTEMEVKPGLIVLGLVLDTLSGRTPLYRLVDFYEGRDTQLLLGEQVATRMFNDDTGPIKK